MKSGPRLLKLCSLIHYSYKRQLIVYEEPSLFQGRSLIKVRESLCYVQLNKMMHIVYINALAANLFSWNFDPF